VQIGITSIGILNGIVGEAAFSGPLALWLDGVVDVDDDVAQVAATAIVVLSITFLTIIFGELVPKRIGQMFPETVARLVAAPMNWLSAATRPFVKLLGASTEGILRLIQDYGTAVAAEWDSMAETAGRESDKALRNIYSAVIRGFAEGEQNRMLQQRLLVSLDSLATARQERLSIAQDSIRASQWLLIAGLGVVLLTTVAVSHAAFTLVRRIALVIISLAISVMLFGIILHDQPFVGGGAVKPDPILKAAQVPS
jgi:hypothetical protein